MQAGSAVMATNVGDMLNNYMGGGGESWRPKLIFKNITISQGKELDV